MKIKPEYIFGGISAVAGLVVIFGLHKEGGGTVNIIPALQNPDTGTSAVTNTPTLTSPTGTYPSQNFGPSHVYHKAVQQAVQQASTKNNKVVCIQSDSCCGPSNKAKRSLTMSQQAVAAQSANIATVSATPQPSYGNTNNPTLNGTIQQYNNQVNAQPLVTAVSTANPYRPVANVPTTEVTVSNF